MTLQSEFIIISRFDKMSFGRFGKQRRSPMYEYVNDATIQPYRKYCTAILTELRDALNNEREIKTEFYLVGSGAKNLVTRNGNGSFDLDYNLSILSMPNQYWNDLKQLKDIVRNTLNHIVDDTLFSDGQDSKSVITSNLILKKINPQKHLVLTSLFLRKTVMVICVG